MSLDMFDLHVLELGQDTQFSNLMDQLGPELVMRHIELRPPKIAPILKGRVGADLDLMLFGQSQGGDHGLAISGMTSTGNAARVQIGHDLGIPTYSLSQIAIDVH
jgi:hypothetical protein